MSGIKVVGKNLTFLPKEVKVRRPPVEGTRCPACEVLLLPGEKCPVCQPKGKR